MGKVVMDYTPSNALENRTFTYILNKITKMSLKSNPQRQLARNYIIMLSLIAIFSIASEIVISKLSQVKINESHLLNTSGRQRMLSQKVMKEMMNLHIQSGKNQETIKQIRDTLSKDLKMLEENHIGLLNRDQSLSLGGENSYQVQEYLENGLKIIQKIKQEKPLDIQHSDLASLKKLSQLTDEFLAIQDKVTQMYVEETYLYELYTERVQLISNLIVIISLLLIAFFISYPSIRMINQYFTSLQESEKKYQLLYDNAQELFCLHNIDSSFYFVSKASGKVLGYESEELIGQTLLSFTHPDDKKKLEETLSKKDQNTSIKYRVRHKTGRYILLESHLNFIKDEDGTIKTFQSSNRDVTQQESMKEAFLESVEKYRELVENARDFIYEVDNKGQFTYINPAFTKISGYTFEEVKGKKFWELIAKEDREKVIKSYAQSYKKQQKVNYLEFKAISKKGNEVYIGQNAINNYSNDGRFSYMRAIARDITRTKEAEERLSITLDQQKIINDIQVCFNSKKAFSKKINQTLQLIGQFCKVDKVRIVGDMSIQDSALFDHLWSAEAVEGQLRENKDRSVYHYHPTFIKIIKERQFFVCEDIIELDDDLRELFNEINMRAFIVVPIFIDYEIQAYASIEARKPRIWSRKETKLMDIIANILPVILEREKYDIRLKKNEKMLKDTQRLAKLGSWELDIFSQSCTWSEETREILEFPENLRSSSLDYFLERFHKQDLKVLKEQIILISENLITTDLKLRIKSNNGTYKFVTLKVEPVSRGKKVVKILGSIQDITSLKNAQEKFQKLFEHSSEATFLIREGKIVSCNLASVRLFGGRKKSDLLDLNFIKNLSADKQNDTKTQSIFPSYENRLMETGNIRFEWLCEKVNGDQFPSEVSLTFMSLENMPTTLAVVRDLTERKIYEEKLKNYQHKIKSLFNSFNEAYVLVSKKLIVLSCNELAKEYALDHWMIELEEGKNLSILSHKKIYNRFIENFEYILEGNIISFEKKQIIEGKHERWFEIKYRPVYDDYNEIFGVSIVTVDITERKNSEEQMMQLTQAMELSQDGFAVLNCDFEFTYLNKALLNAFGYKSLDEVIGQSWGVVYDEKEKKRIQSDIYPIIYKIGNWKGEIKAHSKNGRLLEQDVTLTRLPNHAIVCTFRDNTHRKRNEAVLIKSKEKAEQAMQAKSRFLSTMSHEIRTPMNAVIGMTHLLMNNQPREDQMIWLKTLRFSGENLLALINDILDFSKIESGKITLEQHNISLIEIVDSIKNALSFKASESGIALIADIDPEIPKVLIGDSLRISQILNNLVSNAIKFTHKGNVIISLALSGNKNNKAKVNISVKDTGIGIPPEKLKTIFEDFTQAAADTSRKYGGTGLGLSITKKLLEQMGSRIKVKSKPGIGSTFYFDLLLPISEDQSFEVSHLKSIQEPQEDFRGTRILVVEDNEVNQFVVEQFLQSWNAELEFANHGKSALKKIKEKAYDIVLMDLEMPVMDGYEACMKIRQLDASYYKQVPIIALSASTLNEVKEKVQEAGMTDFVMKPFNPTELYQVIHKYANNHLQVPAKAPSQPSATEDDNVEKNSLVNFEKLFHMTKGNSNFMNKYVEIARKSFDEFNQKIKKALINNDLQLLKDIRHKFKPTFELLEIKEISKFLIKVNSFITEQDVQQESCEDLCNQLDALCFDIIKEMEVKKELLIKSHEN